MPAKTLTIEEPSVQSLLIEPMLDEQPLGYATAFVAKFGGRLFLVTNRHVVTGRDQGDPEKILHRQGGIPNRLRVWARDDRAKGAVQWFSNDYDLYAGDAQNWLEHPVLGAKADIVAMPVEATPPAVLNPYDLDNTGPAIRYGPSDTVNVVGFPFGKSSAGRFAIWSTGFMASDPDVDLEDVPVFLIDCRARQGQSGSPVILFRKGGTVTYEDGSTALIAERSCRLLGVYSGRITADSDLGMVWKASAVVDILRQHQTIGALQVSIPAPRGRSFATPKRG